MVKIRAIKKSSNRTVIGKIRVKRPKTIKIRAIQKRDNPRKTKGSRYV